VVFKTYAWAVEEGAHTLDATPTSSVPLKKDSRAAAGVKHPARSGGQWEDHRRLGTHLSLGTLRVGWP
jgi:hypothetical protein